MSPWFGEPGRHVAFPGHCSRGGQEMLGTGALLGTVVVVVAEDHWQTVTMALAILCNTLDTPLVFMLS